MEIKRFGGWLNEQATPAATTPLVKTGVAKDFSGLGYMANSAMGADEYLRTRSVLWKTSTETTATRQPIVKKEGNSYFLLANSMTQRYMQPDGKNVMQFNYVKGDQLVPVANPQAAKQGGQLKPANAQELEKWQKSGNTTQGTTTDATGKIVSATAAKFNFNFDSGRYAIEDITPDKSAQLMKDLQPILTELATPSLLNGKLEIIITASTSTLGVSSNLKAQLAADGFKSTNPKYSGNDALCNARLATIEKFIIDKFTAVLKTTPEAFMTKVQITKNPLPNSGSGTTDEERKVFQYIAAEVKQSGEKIPATLRLNCGAVFEGEGGQAPSSLNYVGFKKDLYAMATVGDTVTLEFNPLTFPDMVFFKYKEKEFLSTWLGAPSYAGRNFVNELNSSKLADLEEKINTELAACGSTGTVASLAPGAKVGGKWVVKPGVRQKGDPKTFQFPFTKDFAIDKLIVRCFSPLAGTAFTIKTSCAPAKAAPAPKK
jgi:hypothetical protein